MCLSPRSKRNKLKKGISDRIFVKTSLNTVPNCRGSSKTVRLGRGSNRRDQKNDFLRGFLAKRFLNIERQTFRPSHNHPIYSRSRKNGQAGHPKKGEKIAKEMIRIIHFQFPAVVGRHRTWCSHCRCDVASTPGLRTSHKLHPLLG